MKPQSFDKEKLQLNLARLRKGGEVFEVNIDSDKAVNYLEGEKIELPEVLLSQKIFSDAKKGLVASETTLESIFETKDPLQIAEKIIRDGEIQFTAEYRAKLKESKRKKIISMISRFAIDPKSGLPHPPARIENAFEEAKVSIDMFKSVEKQVQEAVKKIRPILPIKLGSKRIRVKVPAVHTGKAYQSLRQIGDTKSENWSDDGSLVMEIEIPAGMTDELFDQLNSVTKGEAESEILKED